MRRLSVTLGRFPDWLECQRLFTLALNYAELSGIGYAERHRLRPLYNGR